MYAYTHTHMHTQTYTHAHLLGGGGVREDGKAILDQDVRVAHRAVSHQTCSSRCHVLFIYFFWYLGRSLNVRYLHIYTYTSVTRPVRRVRVYTYRLFLFGVYMNVRKLPIHTYRSRCIRIPSMNMHCVCECCLYMYLVLYECSVSIYRLIPKNT